MSTEQKDPGPESLVHERCCGIGVIQLSILLREIFGDRLDVSPGKQGDAVSRWCLNHNSVFYGRPWDRFTLEDAADLAVSEKSQFVVVGITASYSPNKALPYYELA